MNIGFMSCYDDDNTSDPARTTAPEKWAVSALCPATMMMNLRLSTCSEKTFLVRWFLL